jgi:hypothetical protein
MNINVNRVSLNSLGLWSPPYRLTRCQLLVGRELSSQLRQDFE